jgi:hypothetical protein
MKSWVKEIARKRHKPRSSSYAYSDIPSKAYYSPTKDQPEELEAVVRKPDKPTDPKKLL